MLRRKGLLGTMPRTFGALASSVVAQDPDHANFRATRETADFDDMTAALGAFTFRVLVAGTVAPRIAATAGAPTAFEVSINEVGVYVRDSSSASR